MTDEPTLADMLAELRILRLEIRTGFAETRAELAEHRLATADQSAAIKATLGAIIDELAAFRADYNEHRHGE